MNWKMVFDLVFQEAFALAQWVVPLWLIYLVWKVTRGSRPGASQGQPEPEAVPEQEEGERTLSVNLSVVLPGKPPEVAERDQVGGDRPGPGPSPGRQEPDLPF